MAPGPPYCNSVGACARKPPPAKTPMPTAAHPSCQETPDLPRPGASADTGAPMRSRRAPVKSCDAPDASPDFWPQSACTSSTAKTYWRRSRQSWAQFIYLGLLLLYLGAGPTFHEILGAVFFGVLLTCAVGLPSAYAYPGGAQRPPGPTSESPVLWFWSGELRGMRGRAKCCSDAWRS